MTKHPVFISREDCCRPLIGCVGRAADEAEAIAAIRAAREMYGDSADDYTGAELTDVVIATGLRALNLPQNKSNLASKRLIKRSDLEARDGAGGFTVYCRCWVGSFDVGDLEAA
jgi:hypothetical protein